jgi:hypothetical protein
VLLDTRAAVHDEESIEQAISVAASIITASAAALPFTLHTTCGTVIDQSATAPRRSALAR